MIRKVISILLAIAMVEGRGLRERALPAFKPMDCPEGVKANKCIDVGGIGMIAVTQESDTVYEGTLTGEGIDGSISVVVILSPGGKSALVNFHHPAIQCDEFDVDLELGSANCVEAGYNADGDDEERQAIRNRGITNANTNGPIIPLGADNPNGIDVKVLFTFDKGFNSAFGAEGRTQVMALVKNAFKDSSIVGRIGTSVNIIPTAKTYSGTYTDSDFSASGLMGKTAKAEGSNHDLYTFITHPGASGVAYGGQACTSQAEYRISMNKGYGPNQCHYYQPPNPIDCSKPTNRIALTAETISHELGHSLGMAHDFKSKGPYVYRKYESESKDCRGLMDYIDDGVGWSACSARDMSRYLTNGGKSKSCLKGSAGGACTDTDNGKTDNWNDGCAAYAKNKHWCGKYNNSVFFSDKMCCACGGGSTAAGK